MSDPCWVPLVLGVWHTYGPHPLVDKPQLCSTKASTPANFGGKHISGNAVGDMDASTPPWAQR